MTLYRGLTVGMYSCMYACVYYIRPVFFFLTQINFWVEPLNRSRPLSTKTLTACHSYFRISVNPALVTAALNSLGIIQSPFLNLLKEGSNIKIKTIV